MDATRLLDPLTPYFERTDLTRDLGRGAAFPAAADTPGGLQAGDRFFRTDLGWACFWDGTRWMTVHEYSAEFTTLGLYTQPYTGGTTSLLVAVPRVDRQIYSTYARILVIVQTTNNAGSYWNISLNADATVLWALNTSANAPNTNLYFQNTLATQNGPSLFTLDVSKTGTPGGLVLHATMHYRLIIS